MCYRREVSAHGLACVNESVGYEGVCSRCDIKHTYIGETSKTTYTRTSEHLANYRAAAAANLPALPENRGGESEGGQQDVKSWMW